MDNEEYFKKIIQREADLIEKERTSGVYMAFEKEIKRLQEKVRDLEMDNEAFREGVPEVIAKMKKLEAKVVNLEAQLKEKQT